MSDRLTLLQKEGASYEKHDDTPTVTFVTSRESLTLPYHSLQWMRRDSGNGTLLLQIDAIRIILHGERLHALWRELQLYRVRQIHEEREEKPDTRQSHVNRIEILIPEDDLERDAG